MDPPSIYPIIVIITGYYTSIMETRLAELFIYLFPSKWDNALGEINKLIQKLNNKMHSETLLALLYDHVTNHVTKYGFQYQSFLPWLSQFAS